VRGRLFAYGVSAAFIAAMLYPLSYAGRKDSFPLSDFPMFARGKKKPTLTQDFAVAFDAKGNRKAIPPELVANAEVLLAQATIRRAVRGGPDARRRFCVEIAERLAGESAYDAWREVRVMRGTYDAVKYLTGEDKSGKEKLWARCLIPRGTP